MQICPALAKAPKQRPLPLAQYQHRPAPAGRFSTELEHRWFQILSAGAGDNASHRCGAGKVNAPHRRVGDQRFHQRRRIFRRTGKIVHHARREARRVKGVDNQSLSGGESSAPLRITVLPQASGVARARVARISGAFHGAMPSTTPAPADAHRRYPARWTELFALQSGWSAPPLHAEYLPPDER